MPSELNVSNLPLIDIIVRIGATLTGPKQRVLIIYYRSNENYYITVLR